MQEIVELIRKCATTLPADVEEALDKSIDVEQGDAKEILKKVKANIKLAHCQSTPMCQDTGTPIFYVTAPAGANRIMIRDVIIDSVRLATEVVPLRPNAVDPVSGVNSGENSGLGFPVIHFSEWEKDKTRIELMLKGGGSENVTQLYSLPDSRLDAGRDLEGVMKCVLDATHKAQGRGCPPYIIGVGVGGLSDETLSLSKKQLMRQIGDVNEDPDLAIFESDALDKVNQLGIGPMGLGGKSTALAVKAGKHHRNPPSFFVGVAFFCWAARRASTEVKM